MAVVGTVEVEIEVEISPDEFYQMYKNDVKELPKKIPRHYEAVEFLEGDGISVGCVIRWHYVLEEGGRCLIAKEKTTVVDDEKRTITNNVIEGEVMNDYKMLNITLVVTPKEDDSHGSVVKWIVEYEKENEDAPTPTAYVDLKKRVTRDLNDLYVKANSSLKDKLYVAVMSGVPFLCSVYSVLKVVWTSVFN